MVVQWQGVNKKIEKEEAGLVSQLKFRGNFAMLAGHDYALAALDWQSTVLLLCTASSTSCTGQGTYEIEDKGSEKDVGGSLSRVVLQP